MPEPRHLQNAPIKEAIIDIRVKARSTFNVEKFNQLRPILAEQFPVVEEIRGSQVTFQFKPNAAKAPDIQDLGLQGYFFKSEDKTTIAQLRVDGFTLNKLKPYTSWEELRPLAITLWDSYRNIAQPEAVTRIALRYINHIEINETAIDFDDFLRAAPPVPQELPQSITRFLYQTTIFVPEDQNFVNVSQLFENPKQPSSLITIIIDIDAYKDISVSPDAPEIFEHFSKLRELKNKVFFNYLTEKTIGLVK